MSRLMFLMNLLIPVAILAGYALLSVGLYFLARMIRNRYLGEIEDRMP